MANELIIKINKDSSGNEVSLNNMPVEAADSIKIFIESFSNFIKSKQISSDVKVSLKDGCIESILVYPEANFEIQNEIQNVINDQSEDNDYLSFLKSIQNRVKANGLDYSILHTVNNQTIDLTERFKAKKFTVKKGSEKKIIEKVIFLEGRLFATGGKINTNIHLEVSKVEYRVSCSQDQAKKLNKRLYDKIYLSVLQKCELGKKETNHFIDSYITEEIFLEHKLFFESVSNNKHLQRFDNIHNKIEAIINDPNLDNAKLLKIMRLFNYSQSDRGALRTILMTLKDPKYQDEKIKPMYEKLAQILRSNSTNNFI